MWKRWQTRWRGGEGIRGGQGGGRDRNRKKVNDRGRACLVAAANSEEEEEEEEENDDDDDNTKMQ